jgi:hypothetical protein
MLKESLIAELENIVGDALSTNAVITICLLAGNRQ